MIGLHYYEFSAAPAAVPLTRVTAASPGGFTMPERFSIPHIHCPPVRGAGDLLKVGLFAGVHGDEPSGTLAAQELAAWAQSLPDDLSDYALHVYPVCNPSGCAARTRHSVRGRDLNREFWCGSTEPEVQWLEGELRREKFDVIIALHEDDTSDGLYGFVRGALLSAYVLEPALAAASSILPRNEAPVIDGFAASHGIIREGYTGILSAPPEQRPHALEIVFETPGCAPLSLQVEAAVLAVKTILTEYRQLLALGQNL